jgi:hypothetical protein
MDKIKLVIFFLGLPLVLFLVWRRGPIILLYFALTLCWFPQRLNNYGPLESILESTSFTEMAVAVAFIMSFGFRNPRRTPYLGLLVLFSALAMFPWLWRDNPDPLVAWRAMRWNVIIPCMAYVAVWRIVQTPSAIDKLIKMFLGGQVLLAIITLLAPFGLIVGFGGSADLSLTDEKYRLAASYMIPLMGKVEIGGNLTVFFHCYAIAFLLSYVIYHKINMHTGIFLPTLLIINVSAVLITGSRTPIIAMLAIIISILVTSGLSVSLEKYSSINKLKALLLLSFIMIFLIIFVEIFKDVKLGQRIIDVANLITGSSKDMFEKGSGYERMKMWEEFIPTMQKAPFGAGFIESFSYLGGVDLGPHAQYLFLLLGAGLPGLLIWLLFLGFIMRDCLTASIRRTTPYTWIILGTGGAIVSYLVNGFMVHTYLVRGADMSIFLLAGLAMKAAYFEKMAVRRMQHLGEPQLSGRRQPAMSLR